MRPAILGPRSFARSHGEMVRILVFNAGSSSLKFSLFEAQDERVLADGGIDWKSEPTRLVMRQRGGATTSHELQLHAHADAVARVIAEIGGAIGDIDLVAHRVVHGGARYAQAVRISPTVRKAIDEVRRLVA